MIGSTLGWIGVLAPVSGYLSAFRSVTQMIHIFYDYLQHERIEKYKKGEKGTFAQRSVNCHLVAVTLMTLVFTSPCFIVFAVLLSL